MSLFFTPRCRLSKAIFLACFTLFFGAATANAQTYYYKGTGLLTATSSWGTNTDGSGTAPANFTNILCTYEIRNTSAVTLTSNWTVSGLASKVVLGNPAAGPLSLTIASGVTISAVLDITAATTGSNTLILQGASAPTWGVLNTASTVQYDGASAQTVLTNTTYGNLVVSNTAGAKSFSGNLYVTTSFTLNSGVTLNAGTSRILRNGFGTANININGILNTTNTSGLVGTGVGTLDNVSTVITLGASSVIQYAAASAQNITARTDYANVELSGNSVKTTQGATSVSGSISIGAGSLANNQVLTVAGSVTGAGEYASASGTLNIAGALTVTTLTLSGTSTVNYNGTSAQSVRSGAYGNLTFSNSGRKTFSGSVSLVAGRTFLINSPAVVDAGTSQITAAGATVTVTINGTLVTANLSGLSGSSTTTISNVNTTITPFTTTSTVQYNAATGNQVVTVVAPDSIYANLLLTGGSLKTTAGNFFMLGGTTFTLDQGTSFNMGTRNIRRSGSTGTVTLNFNGTLYTALAAGFTGNANTMVSSTGTTVSLGAASVVNYTKTTAQTVSSRSDYAILRLNGAGIKTLDGPVTVNDSMNLMESQLGLNGFVLTNKGNFGGAGTLTGSAASGLVFDGSPTNVTISFTQTSATTRTVGSLTVNRSGGVTLGSAADVGTLLTLTSGPLILGSQTLTLGGTIAAASGTITGSSTAGIIVNGTGSFGSIPFTPGSQELGSLTLNRTSSGSVTLGSNLTLVTGGTLTFTNGKLNIGSNTLTINGNISNISAANSFSLNGSSAIVIGGSGALTASTIYFDQASATTSTINNLTLNRTSASVTLGNTLLLAGTLALNNGSLVTGGNLTLLSTAAGTARVSAITGTGAISGNVIAQRYIPSVTRRWRFMSSCMSNATLEDWRSEIFITGNGTGNTPGTLNSNGFDATVNNAHGAYYYNETAAGGSNVGWVGVTNNTPSLTNVPLVTGRGYRVFIRGDRSDLTRLTDNNPTQNAVTLDLRGTINTGNIVMPVSYTNTGSPADDGWCLLGNPYPCPFDWNAFWNDGTNFTNIDPTIYVYDPVANSYRSFNATSSGTLTGGIIAQGQSFFVKATGASPAITFRESFKSTGTPVYLFKTAVADELHVRLKSDSLNYDDFILKFITQSQKGHDGYDIKAMVGAINISGYASDSIFHALDARPATAANDTVLLRISGPTGQMSLQFTSLQVAGKYFYLHDLFLDSIQPLAQQPVYTFNVQQSNPATYGNNRFRIIIGNQPALPVTLLQFGAEKNNDRVNLSWTTASEVNSSYFEVQRGTVPGEFYPVGQVKASGNTTVVRSYAFTDGEAPTGKTLYYRLMQVDRNQEFVYSETRVIAAAQARETKVTNVWPNPARGVLHIDAPESWYKAGVYSLDGRAALVTGANGSNSIDVTSLNRGMYLLKLHYPNGREETVKVVLE